MLPVFVCNGGAGSSHLAGALKALKKVVHLRPATYFLPNQFPQCYSRNERLRKMQRLSVNGFDDYPDPKLVNNRRRMKQRVGGFEFDCSKTLNDNYVRYYEWVASLNNVVALFSRAPQFQFFSRNGLRNAVFVVRHPLDNYISLTKPQRHEEFVKPFGGYNTSAAVEWWISEWNNFVSDGVNANARIIQYHNPRIEADDSPIIRKAFRRWRRQRRKLARTLTPDLEEKLRVGTRTLFDEVFAGQEW